MRNRTWLAAMLLASLAFHPLTAQQGLNDPTTQQVAQHWQSPPPEFGPEPYYGLNGPVTLEVVQRDLDRMTALGFHAVTVQYGYGSSRDYLSPEYLAFFRQFVAEARKRQMRVWIVDDAGYPSGFAGGKFTAEHPELRMQALAATQVKQAAAGASIDLALTPNTVAVSAIRNGTGELQQIPFSGTQLHWTAPAGEWAVYVIEHLFRTSPTRSDTNPKRTKDGTQSLEDYLDPAATAQYLVFTHEAYAKAVGDEFGKTILGFRGDEPDYSISGLPWTPKSFAIFQERKGYDVKPYLAALLQGRNAQLTAEQLLVKADYYDVFSQLFRDGFFKPQADWCAAHHLSYQVHLNHEEMQLDLAHSEGDFFRDMRSVQEPGIDSIWHQIWTDTVSDFPRFASSAAHLYGHPNAFTESFAAYRPAPDLPMARYILNEQFVRGINKIEVMYFPTTSTPGHDHHSFMDEPGFAELMQYSARMSYLMTQGRPAADVALLLPAESLWMGSAVTDDTFVSTERMLSERQIDFDIVDEDAIASILPLERGSFVTASGNRYRTVLVPHATLLPAATLARLKNFAAAGGKVVFIGAAPEQVGGANNRSAKPLSANELSWAAIATGELPHVPTPPAQPPAAAPEPMPVPEALWSTVARNLPASALRLDQPSTALRFLHREWKDATIYLVFNESAVPFDRTVTLRSRAGASVEAWDVQAGSIAPVTSEPAAGGRSLHLHLDPYATAVFVVR